MLSLPKIFFTEFMTKTVLILKGMSPLIKSAIHFQNDGAFDLLLVSSEECWLVPLQVQVIG